MRDKIADIIRGGIEGHASFDEIADAVLDALATAEAEAQAKTSQDDALRDAANKLHDRFCPKNEQISALEKRVKAADVLATLVGEGECPWREDCRQYIDWHQDRSEALAAYLATGE